VSEEDDTPILFIGRGGRGWGEDREVKRGYVVVWEIGFSLSIWIHGKMETGGTSHIQTHTRDETNIVVDFNKSFLYE
jgi:hypothetical protein